MKTFTATKHFNLGPSIIAQCTGAERPEPGEIVVVAGTLAREGEPDGEQWVCTSAEPRTEGWKLRLHPTEQLVAAELDPVLAGLRKIAAQNTAAQERVKAWMAGRQRDTCPTHGTALEYNFIEMVRAVMGGSEPAAIYFPCPTCHGSATQTRENERLVRMGVPKNMLHATLDNWTPRTPDEVSAKATLRAFATRQRGFIALIGFNKGTGKTHNGVGVLRTYRSGRLLTQQELLNALRRTYRDDHAEDIVAVLKRTPCLVLDEMGLSTGGKDEFPTIHDILSHRYNQELTTVLIGNFTTKAELLEVVGPRMADRLTECGWAVLHFAGESHRGAKRESYLL